jgi:hypothetical protein
VIRKWYHKLRSGSGLQTGPVTIPETASSFGGRGWWLVGAFALLLGVTHYGIYNNKEDYPKELAVYLEDHLGPNETFFFINGHQITYHLTGRTVPTPYVHSSLLFLDHHVRAFQVDEVVEADRIINNPKVVCLVGRRDDPEVGGVLGQRLMDVFEPVDSVGEQLVVYRRR